MPTKSPKNEKLGFSHWMNQVLVEAERAAHAFDADAVHDLRVALRRCRSMADGFRSVDPDPAWRAMKKAGGRVFKSLGDLRDVQVMRDWVKRLAPTDDALAPLLDRGVQDREATLKKEGEVALQRFDAEKWTRWTQHLSRRAAHVPVEGMVFQYLALSRWREARGLQAVALRNRNPSSWHNLRIGIKRFRYTVENFLPERHKAWGKDLKHLQDLLGEVHDFDVLWEQIQAYGFEDGEIVAHWQSRLADERKQRIETYRSKMLGRGSLWGVWRKALPEGREEHNAFLAKARTLTSLSGGSVTHVRHVARLALQIFEGLQQTGVVKKMDSRVREILQYAALLQDAGHFKGKSEHHKRSFRVLLKMDPPLGWKPEEWRLVAALVRYHRGSEPRPGQKAYTSIASSQRRRFALLSPILRMANALDCGHGKKVKSIRVQRTAETVQLMADGYAPESVSLSQLAIAKLMLETACGAPISLQNAGREGKPKRGSRRGNP